MSKVSSDVFILQPYGAEETQGIVSSFTLLNRIIIVYARYNILRSIFSPTDPPPLPLLNEPTVIPKPS